MSSTRLFIGDAHIPYHSRSAMDAVLRLAARTRPAEIVILGDWLDCNQFSQHPKTLHEDRDRDLKRDLELAVDYLSELRKCCKRIVYLEGNHEYRLNRWLARHEAASIAGFVSLEEHLKDTVGVEWIPYRANTKRRALYRVNSRTIAVHAWSEGVMAPWTHIRNSCGNSVIYGHTHRLEMICQGRVTGGHPITAASAGCLCSLQPWWASGKPTNWVHGAVLMRETKKAEQIIPVLIQKGGAIVL